MWTDCTREAVAAVLTGKTVALVGSGPGVLDNKPGFVDSHDVVVRVNNYKTGPAAGARCDVFYSFFGSSIKKKSLHLQADGVKLCICKCPDAKFIDSAWHETNGKPHGVDFRYIYRDRADFWFCPTYVPTVEAFLVHFRLLGDHVPTTGFSALLDVLSYAPTSIYMTGFDFFQSGIHNVNETWRAGNPTDPIGHDPNAERAWFAANAARLPVTMDQLLEKALTGAVRRRVAVQPFKKRRGLR
jgi:hypothetical protein